MSETTRKVTLAHGQDGMVAHATVTGFNPADEHDMLFIRHLREAIDEGVRVIAFDDSGFQVEHIFDQSEGDA